MGVARRKEKINNVERAIQEEVMCSYKPLRVTYCASGPGPAANTAQQNIAFLGRGCWGAKKTEGQVKVGWLLGRKDRRKQEQGRVCGGFLERERENSRERGNKTPPHTQTPQTLEGSIESLVILKHENEQ